MDVYFDLGKPVSIWVFNASSPEHGSDDFMLSGLQHPFRSDPSSSGGSPGTNYASGGPEYDSFCLDGIGSFVHIPFWMCQSASVGRIVRSSHNRDHFLSSDVPIRFGALSQKWGECPEGSVGGQPWKYAGTLSLYDGWSDIRISCVGVFWRFSVRPLSCECHLFGTAVRSGWLSDS